MRCYICNKELVDTPAGVDQCQAHGEHIIHNGIRGKLISRHILCEKCGSDYSKEDAAFCRIFAPIIEVLKDRLIPADHGKNGQKILPGSLFDNPTFNPYDSSRLVNVRDGVVSPVNPFYEIKDNILTVYAEKHRIDHYVKEVAKQLNATGKDITDYTVEKVTDLCDKGYLAYFFSKGNATFDEDFKNGIVKIAVEYALRCGVPREQLAEVLTIKGDGKAIFDCTNTKMFPFVPISIFDILYEDCRYFYEEGYPSHTLRLFSTRYDDGTAALYCYVDLFSTFQYYVLLNGNYKGREVNETYAQRLLKEEKLNVSDYDPSDLDIVIHEYGIDMSQCTATAYEDQLRYVQECIRSYPPQTYDLQASLNNACAKLQNMFMAILCKQKVSKGLGDTLDRRLGTICNKNVVAQIEKFVVELTKNMNFADAMETGNAFSESAKLECYRKSGFDVIDGKVTIFSMPDYCMKLLDERKDAVKEYTNVKFSHLESLCFNPKTLE